MSDHKTGTEIAQKNITQAAQRRIGIRKRINRTKSAARQSNAKRQASRPIESNEPDII